MDLDSPPIDPSEWLATEPRLPLVPAIRPPREPGFLARLFGARPEPVFEPVGALAPTADGLSIDAGVAARLRWSDTMATLVSRAPYSGRPGGEVSIALRARGAQPSAGVDGSVPGPGPGVASRHGHREIEWRVLAPDRWLQRSSWPEARSRASFLSATDMGPLWNAIRWFALARGEPPLPPWNTPPDVIRAVESAGSPVACTACGSHRIRFLDTDIFRCLACGYEGGEGVLRRAERARAAHLRGLVGPARSAEADRLLGAIRGACEEALRLAGDIQRAITGSTKDTIVPRAVGALRRARVELGDLALLFESDPVVSAAASTLADELYESTRHHLAYATAEQMVGFIEQLEGLERAVVAVRTANGARGE